jgi:hypothetical protein
VVIGIIIIYLTEKKMSRVKLFVIDEKPYLGSTEEIFVGDDAIVTVNGQYPMIVKCENETVLNLIKDPKLTLTKSFKIHARPDKLKLTPEDIDRILSIDEGVCEVENFEGSIRFI